MSITVKSVSAQQIFTKGDRALNLGIGLGSSYGGNGYTSSIPPISASFEQGVVDGLLDGKASIGAGAYLGYSSNKWETSYFNGTKDVEYGFKYSYIMIGARGAFHYQLIDKLDSYAGAILGYNIVKSKYFGDSAMSSTATASSDSALGYSAFIGGRYHFSEKYSAFAELGYGISVLQLGISIKL